MPAKSAEQLLALHSRRVRGYHGLGIWGTESVPDPQETALNRTSRNTLWVVTTCAFGLLILVPLFGVLLFAAMSGFFSGDAPSPPAEAAFVIPSLNLADEENAYCLIRAAAASVRWPGAVEETIQGLAEGAAWDMTIAEELIAANGPAFVTLEHAFSLPHGEYKARSSAADETMPDVSECIRLPSLYKIRSRVRLERGDERGAIEDARRIVRLGSALQKSKGPLLSYIIGTAIRDNGLVLLATLLRETALPPTVLKREAQELERCADGGQGLADAFRREYLEVVAALDQELSFRQSPVFKPNKTRSICAKAFRTVVHDATLPMVAAEWRESAQFFVPEEPDGFLQAAKRFLRGNAVGEMALQMTMPNLERPIEVKYFSETKLSLTRTLLALKCYHLEHGELPETLDALVPEYLDAVPLDDFDGKPIRYSREKKIVYSIGRDLIDSGGAPEERPFGNVDEPTVSVDF